MHVGKQSDSPCDATEIKNQTNHRGWSIRLSRGGWMIVAIRYELVGLLLMVIVNLIIFFNLSLHCGIL